MSYDTEILETLTDELVDKLDQLSSMTPREAKFSETIDKIKVAIGMRRTGKTYFLHQMISQLLAKNIPLSQILYINFEDDRLLPMDTKRLAELLDAFYSLHPENHEKTCYLFLDEIQNVENWSIVIRRFYDSKKVKLFLTGSSAKLLSKEIATELRGRSLAIEIWPYSFWEYLQAKAIAIDTSSLSKKIQDQLSQLFQSYLQEGGFPEVTHYTSDIRQKILQEYIDVVIYRDIIERHQISNTTVMRYMILSMIKNVAKPFSINKFYNDLKSQGYKISKDLLYHYADYIEDAYLTFSVPLYSTSLRKRQSNTKKIYAIDPGLVNACTLNYQKDLGKLFENVIYLELRRLGYTVYYYLTSERYEVDFLIENRQGLKKLLQIAWDMSDLETGEREKRALERAKEELNIPGEIVTPLSYLANRNSLMLNNVKEKPCDLTIENPMN